MRRRRSCSIAALHDDVLTEILLLVPPEDLIRSKFVCKRWLTHISGDRFRRLYRLRHPPSFLIRTDTAAFFLFNPLITGDNFSPYNLFPFPNPKIMSSCNGLMILQTDNLNHYVYNATTKQSIQLIPSTHTTSNHNHKVVGLHLAYDPLTSPNYKILCFMRASDISHLYYMELYDSVSRTWSLCEGPHVGIEDMDLEHGVYCKKRIFFRNSYLYIFYFDIETTAIRYLAPPSTPRPGAVCRSNILREYGGRLYYSAVVLYEKGESLALWELQEDLQEDATSGGYRWVLKYCDPEWQWKGTHILGFIGESDGKETSTLVIANESGNIVSYSFVDNKYKELVDYTPHKFRSQDVHHFCESWIQ